jgi:hypothetical protein
MAGTLKAVRSVDEEDALMGRCPCGASRRLARNAVRPMSGRWLDLVGMNCPSCGSDADFAFDVTAFFEARPGVWNGQVLM